MFPIDTPTCDFWLKCSIYDMMDKNNITNHIQAFATNLFIFKYSINVYVVLLLHNKKEYILIKKEASFNFIILMF